jgi:hypothetical protein
MKSLLGKLVVVLIGLLIFGNAEVWGADWRFVEDSIIDYSRLYYDAQSIGHPSKNIFQITVKSQISEKAKKEIELRGWSYTIKVYEFNCKEKIFRLLSSKRYHEDGEFISHLLCPEEWLIITPKTSEERLYKIVCK